MKYTTITAAALAALLLPFATLAEDDNIQLANATGYGTTVEEAKKAAVRSAVEAVVGAMVDADTLVENDELVQDVIDTYSNGTATEVKTIGEPKKTDTGLWQVRVQAKVRKTALVEKLKTATKSEAGVEGESLYQRMVSARQNLAGAEAVMKKLFDPERVQFILKAEPVAGADGSALILDDATGEVSVRVKCGVDMLAYKQWVDEILEKLGPMATAKHEGVTRTSAQEKYKGGEVFLDYDYNVFDGDVKKDTLRILCNTRAFKTVGLSFDKDKTALLAKTLPQYSAVVKVSLLDKTGEEIKIANFANYEYTGGVFTGCGGSSERFVVPAWGGRRIGMGSSTMRAAPQFNVAFGKMAEQDVKDIDKITVEVKVQGEPQN